MFFYFTEVYAASVHTDLDSVLILTYSSKIQTWTVLILTNFDVFFKNTDLVLKYRPGLCFNFDVFLKNTDLVLKIQTWTVF